jgi:hypothetical protein
MSKATDDFDPERYRLKGDPQQLAHTSPFREKAKKKQSEPFLKGPIPWSWIEAAMSLRGSALEVGLILWYQSGLKKSLTVKLRPTMTSFLEIERKTLYRALKALEDAKLILVVRSKGSSPTVTLLKTGGRSKGGD